MKRPLFFFLTLLLIIFTFLFDHLARHFYLYWSQDWIDSMVHFLGGLGTSLFCLWATFLSGISTYGKEMTSRRRAFIVALLSSLIVGILWEIYEYKIGFTVYSTAFVYDSLSDIFMDVAGGLLGYFILLSALFNDVN